MNNQYPKEKELIPIGKAAEILEVSIDTIRRWDKEGILHSSRPDGKTRHFSLKEVEDLKFAKPITISELSKKLNISQSTLRRLEKKNLIQPTRNNNGERLYTNKSIEKFLDSEYFLRQRVVENKILEPLVQKEVEKKSAEVSDEQKVIATATNENKKEIGRLSQFQKNFYAAGILLWTMFVTLTLAITFFYILFPDSTARFFGLRYVESGSPIAKNEAVLGTSDSKNAK